MMTRFGFAIQGDPEAACQAGVGRNGPEMPSYGTIRPIRGEPTRRRKRASGLWHS